VDIAARWMETKTRFTVDSAHCQRAADELYEVLLAQERAFLARWHAARGMGAIVKIARVVGFVASLLGLVLISPLLYFDTTSWATQPPPWTIALFIAFAAFFVFQPRIATGIREWSLRSADKRARRHADKGLRMARNLAPFEADYDLKGDLLIYTRGGKDQWQLGWSQALAKFRVGGVAVQMPSITVIFKRSSSLMPAVLILQQGRDWTGEILRDVGVTVETRPIADAVAPLQG
jgi:hypothetical protein